MGQGDPGGQHQAAGMKSRPKIGKTFHNVSLGEWRALMSANRHFVRRPPMSAPVLVNRVHQERQAARAGSKDRETLGGAA